MNAIPEPTRIRIRPAFRYFRLYDGWGIGRTTIRARSLNDALVKAQFRFGPDASTRRAY